MNTKTIALLSLLAMPAVHASAIIFDLNQVLMYSSRVATCKHIGLSTIARYSFFENPFSFDHLFFEFLDRIKPISEEHPAWLSNTKLLPQVMSDWLKGTVRSNQMKQLIQEHIKLCTNEEQQRAILALSNVIFTPSLFAQTFVPCDDAIALVRLCKRLGHKTYILSNLDSETYEYLRELYPWFWKLFDGVMISGTVACIKPDPQIYTITLEHFGIDPHDAVFIDDVDHNVQSARTLGIFGIVCKQQRVGHKTVPYMPYTSNQVKMWLDGQRRKQLLALKKTAACAP